jgi:hypothetical protein
MSDVSFQVLDVSPQRYAAVPTLLFRLGVQAPSGESIQNIALRCQIRIEPQQRKYSPSEEDRLVELFGDTPRWGDTLKPFLWTNVSLVLPGLEGASEVDLPVPCSYDLEVAACKFLHSLDSSEIPLVMLFSGTVFARGENGMKVTQISWSKEARYQLPVRVWRELMDLYFPNSGWLRLRRDTLDALLRFKAKRALPTWDQVMEALMQESQRPGG